MSENSGYVPGKEDDDYASVSAPTLHIRGGAEPVVSLPHSLSSQPKAGAISRAPNNVNADLKVAFSDVFAEPGDVSSFDAVWNLSETVFDGTKFCCYRVLTTILALPCAFVWGIHFSCLAFCCAWNVSPYTRALQIKLGRCGVIWRALVQCYLEPYCDSLGRVFSHIKLSFTDTAKVPEVKEPA